ncbi:hypothetical protein AAG906_011844 [Vitis piasezkii]
MSSKLPEAQDMNMLDDDQKSKERRITKRSKSFTATACRVLATCPYKTRTNDAIHVIPLASSKSDTTAFSSKILHSDCPFVLFPMADSILTSDHLKKALHVLGLLSLLLLMQKVGATEFKVGGPNGWSVPADAALSYNQWAERNRFQRGDSLLFVYPAGNDSVLYVNKADHDNCNTATPLELHKDGHTTFKLNQSGAHYFISGVKDNCLKNEKLVVVVLAERSKESLTPASPPSGSTDIVPSPAPTGEESPSPPEGLVQIAPSPPPGGEEPSPSGASSVFISFIGSIGALVGSSLLLA